MTDQPATTDLNLSDREFRGLLIALSDSIKSVGAGRYIVNSQSEAGKSYRVWRSPGGEYRCNCRDASRAGVTCKHAHACRLRATVTEKIMAARRAGQGDALIGRMLTLSLQSDAGLVDGQVGMTADLVLLVAKTMDERQGMGRAA